MCILHILSFALLFCYPNATQVYCIEAKYVIEMCLLSVAKRTFLHRNGQHSHQARLFLL